MMIAGIPIGGLSREQAAERVSHSYSTPIELKYQDAIIQLLPQDAGFQLDLNTMLDSADRQVNKPAFWDSLWNHNTVPKSVNIPLAATVQEEKLRLYLHDQITLRYDHLPTESLPVAGTTLFTSGQPGISLDIDQSIQPIETALRSLTERTVVLPLQSIKPLPPKLEDLNILLHQIIHRSGFDGLVELYLKDLQTNKGLYFGLLNGTEIQPEIAFTAASTMKIPIAISVLHRSDEPTPQSIRSLFNGMIVLSQNPPADELMEYLDPDSGPLIVTNDLQALGLENSFIAGFFYSGAPLLKRFATPANTRTDIDLQPDIYNQTTPREIGLLLEYLYDCAEYGKGAIIDTFKGQVSQAECSLIIHYLMSNKTGLLLEAGLPEGTGIAHKHGWIEETDGLLHTMSDVAIIYTPGGNYVLTVFVYRSDQLVFDPANILVARLSQAVYNFFNVYSNNPGIPPAYVP